MTTQNASELGGGCERKVETCEKLTKCCVGLQEIATLFRLHVCGLILFILQRYDRAQRSYNIYGATLLRASYFLCFIAYLRFKLLASSIICSRQGLSAQRSLGVPMTYHFRLRFGWKSARGEATVDRSCTHQWNMIRGAAAATLTLSAGRSGTEDHRRSNHMGS